MKIWNRRILLMNTVLGIERKIINNVERNKKERNEHFEIIWNWRKNHPNTPREEDDIDDGQTYCESAWHGMEE